MSTNRNFIIAGVNTKENSGVFKQLPHDVILLILARLPIRKLGQMTWVCKYFHILVNSSIPHHLGKPFTISNKTKIPATFDVVSKHLLNQFKISKECRDLKNRLKNNSGCNRTPALKYTSYIVPLVFALTTLIKGGNAFELISQLDYFTQGSVYAGGLSLTIFSAGLSAYSQQDQFKSERLAQLSEQLDGSLAVLNDYKL